MEFSKNALLDLLKSKMAEIRHLENRHDVIFSAEGGPIWIKFPWYVIPEPRITLQGAATW